MAIGFRAKNKDEISATLTEVISDSKNKVINILLNQQSAGGSSSGGSKYLGSKFRAQLNDLMGELNSCNVHFIRCI